ncbi:MAG: tetratricopeptide repeat protein [Bacteroidaceae bacterium]
MKRAIDDSTLKRLNVSISDDLKVRHISEAIDKLGFLIQNGQDDQIRADFEELRTNYHAMLSFLSQGGTDEHRADVQEKMARRVWMVLQSITRNIRLHLSNNDIYCKTYNQMSEQGMDTRLLMQQWSSTPPSEERLALQDHIFDLLWTSPLWKPSDRTLWQDFIQRQDTLVQQHLMWAIFLSFWEYPDLEKLSLIIRMSDSQQHGIRMAAITALAFIIRQHKDILSSLGILSPDTIPSRLLPFILEIEQEFALILASKKDTENEAKELDAIPQDDISKALKKALQIKIRYIKRRVSLGYDPNLTRLSLLHSSRFLSICSHWFLPFDSSHPLAQALSMGKDGQANETLSRLTEVSNDCDVDKYAMCEMIDNNKGLAKTMTEQMEQAGIGLHDVKLPDLTLRHMMQNLFRFFTQSPICQSLLCPFDKFHMLISDERFRTQDSEDLCIKCVHTLLEAECHTCAAEVLDSMAKQFGTSAELLYLRGQCHEKAEMTKEAYRCYVQAALLEEPDEEQTYHIYRCCKSLDKKEEEYKWLDILIQRQPEHIHWLFEKAANLTHDKRWNEARDVYYHIIYEHPSETDAVRGIVTCELMLQNIPAAQKYSEKLLDDPVPCPWMSRTLLGNLAFIQGDWKCAKVNYTSAAENYIKDTNGTYAGYLEQYESYREMLEANKISKIDIDLMRDSLWVAFIHGL